MGRKHSATILGVRFCLLFPRDAGAHGNPMSLTCKAGVCSTCQATFSALLKRFLFFFYFSQHSLLVKAGLSVGVMLMGPSGQETEDSLT